MAEQDSNTFLQIPDDEMHPFASSDPLIQNTFHHKATNRSLLPLGSSQDLVTKGNRSAGMIGKEFHIFDGGSNQAAPMPLSQNTLVSFLESSKEDERLPLNGLRYFHVKSEPPE